MAAEWEAVIGLEIHVQLATRTKLFCGDAVEFGAPPNTRVCPVCLGLPGALPVLNGAAVLLAARAALALGCRVHETSIFARKNYFYPDLPKGYQITQFERPLATGGFLELPPVEPREPDRAAPRGPAAPGRVRIRRIHMEEDAGKSLHDRVPGRTAIDLNRAGVPLVEIVTEPDLRSPAQARAFLNRLKQTLEYIEVSDCDMEKGSLRVDANVSVRPPGSAALGTKTEVKNMNSFANVEHALAFEIDRQVAELRAGRAIAQETLLWDAGRAEARPMRSKEESHDYRYFPEPDLPPLHIDAGQLGRMSDELPELPAARAARLRARYGLSAYDADVLTASRALADYFEDAAAAAGDPKATANRVMTDVLGWANQRQCTIREVPVTPAQLGRLVALVADGTLSTTLARRVFERVADTRADPDVIVHAEGLAQVRDAAQLEAWAVEVVADHPAEAERYRNGEDRLLGFFMGLFMKRSRGKADPRQATELLRTRLGR